MKQFFWNSLKKNVALLLLLLLCRYEHSSWSDGGKTLWTQSSWSVPHHQQGQLLKSAAQSEFDSRDVAEILLCDEADIHLWGCRFLWTTAGRKRWTMRRFCRSVRWEQKFFRNWSPNWSLAASSRASTPTDTSSSADTSSVNTVGCLSFFSQCHLFCNYNGESITLWLSATV